MKYFLLLPLFVLCLLCQCYAQTPFHSWTGLVEGTGATTSALRKVAVDQNENCIVLGDFSGTIDLALDASVYNVTAQTSKDYFVAKYSPAGTLLWVNIYVPPTANCFLPGSIICDHANNIFLWGNVSDTIDVDLSGNVVNLYPADSLSCNFFMKMDSNGGLLWAQTTQTSNNQVTVFLLAVNHNDEVYLSGTFRDTVDLDFGPGTSMDTTQMSTNSDSFIIKLDANGNFIWHKSIKGAGNAGFGCIIFDDADNMYLSGSFTYLTDFDPGPGIYNVTTNGNNDGFVLTLDENGNFIRFWKIGVCTGFDTATRMVIDEFGFLYIYGAWSNIIDFDLGTASFQLTAGGSEDYYLVKMDKYGHGVWALNVATHVTGFDYVTAQQLSYGPVNGLLLSGQFTMDYDFDPSPTAMYPVTHSAGDGYLEQIDVNGLFKGVHIYTSVGNESISSQVATSEGVVYVSGFFGYSVDFDPGPGQYILTSVPAGASNSFLSCLNQNANFATGSVFRDMNLNGIYDSGDFPLGNTVVHESGGGNFLTSNSGYYLANFDTGNVVLTYNNLPTLATAVPASYTISNSTFNNTSTNKDFAIQVPSGTTDGAIVLTNVNLTRAGRTSYLNITYTNHGTTPISGEIKLVKDPDMNNLLADILPNLTSGDSIWWNFSNLLPMETSVIHVSTLISSGLGAGYVLHSNATLNLSTGDAVPIDNVDSIDLVVTASFDPNDKQVLPSGGFSTQQIANGEYLEYIIRFQNTGNDTAFIVQVLDTLSSWLDVSTFEVLSSSHDYTVSLTGNHILRFIFDNILLPDSNTNEAASHGFVRYRIKAVSNATLGTVIDNTAYIYFDFNAPVSTNMVSTQIIPPLNVAEIGSHANDISIYPNPLFSGEPLRIVCDLSTKSILEIKNMSGASVLTYEIPAGQRISNISLPKLATGVYHCRISNQDAAAHFKLVILSSQY